jgi:outer membrane protein OmpA-like peptidoglycan-associated protein
MRHALGIALLLPALLMFVAGCATKNFVRELVTKKEAELDQKIVTVEGRVGTESQRLDKEAQRISTVETRVTEEGQRVEGVGSRVATVEKSVSDVGESAKGAQTRADAAFGRAEEVDNRLTRVWSKRNARDLVDTVQVLFGFDRWDLNDAAQTALLTVVKELKQNPNLTVDLQGYTDPTGPREYNIQLSQRRVEAVRRYLIEQGLELPRVSAVGLGPINEKVSPQERAKLRRVTVKMMVAPE